MEKITSLTFYNSITIEFSILNFDLVIDAVSQIKNITDLNNSNLWKVI